jgi:hypothetical protein
VQNGRCVSYINMTTGRSAIFGFRQCAAAGDVGAAQDEPPADALDRPASSRIAPHAAAPAPPARAQSAGPLKKKTQDAPRSPPAAAAVRPRRAEAGREH